MENYKKKWNHQPVFYLNDFLHRNLSYFFGKLPCSKLIQHCPPGDFLTRLHVQRPSRRLGLQEMCKVGWSGQGIEETPELSHFDPWENREALRSKNGPFGHGGVENHHASNS